MGLSLMHFQSAALWYKDLLLLMIACGAIAVAITFQKYFQRTIDPRGSMPRFLLFLFVNILALFCLIFLVGFAIIYFKEFFFKT
jgi:hypothetical protein